MAGIARLTLWRLEPRAVIKLVMECTRMPRTMSAAELKAKCLRVMDDVAATGKSVVVTKRGKPVAQLAPTSKKSVTLRGFLKGRVRSRGDIVSAVGDARR